MSAASSSRSPRRTPESVFMSSSSTVPSRATRLTQPSAVRKRACPCELTLFSKTRTTVPGASDPSLLLPPVHAPRRQSTSSSQLSPDYSARREREREREREETYMIAHVCRSGPAASHSTPPCSWSQAARRAVLQQGLSPALAPCCHVDALACRGGGCPRSWRQLALVRGPPSAGTEPGREPGDGLFVFLLAGAPVAFRRLVVYAAPGRRLPSTEDPPVLVNIGRMSDHKQNRTLFRDSDSCRSVYTVLRGFIVDLLLRYRTICAGRYSCTQYLEGHSCSTITY